MCPLIPVPMIILDWAARFLPDTVHPPHSLSAACASLNFSGWRNRVRISTARCAWGRPSCDLPCRASALASFRPTYSTRAHPRERHENAPAADFAKVKIGSVTNGFGLRIFAGRFPEDVDHSLAFHVCDGHDEDIGLVEHVRLVRRY